MAMSQNLKYTSTLETCVDNLKRWKKFIDTYLEGEEKAVELQKLENVTKQYMEINNNFNKAENAIKAVHSHVGDKDLNIKEVYEEAIGEQADINYSNEIWCDVFGGNVTEVTQKEKKLNSSQYESYDDSLMCSNVFTPPVDPISKVPIKNPVKNKKCQHVYESSTIFDFIKQRRKDPKCPYIGCQNKKLSKDDLEEDVPLREKIQRFFQENTELADEDSD